MNPFQVPTPAVVAFSGGRTSGLMLRRILDAYNNTLPDDVFVCFANTGLEHPATLRFVADVEINWGVKVNWLEYRPERTFEVVTYETASRNGEPFTHLLNDVTSLPNPRARRCTTQLKMRTMKRWLDTKGIEDHYKVIGLRADEPLRVAKMRGDTSQETPIMPLAQAGITKRDVDTFWKNNNFDLDLPFDSNMFGNCVGCFLKSKHKLKTIMREMPEAFDWWIEAEKKMESKADTVSGMRFRIDRPKYADLVAQAQMDQDLGFDEPDLTECSCTD